MNKTKFTLGKFSFPVYFLQPTVHTVDWANQNLQVYKTRLVFFAIFWLVFLYWHEINFSDYKIKMQNLEFTKNIPKCGHGKRCHNCKRCPYVTKTSFYMVNHVKRHRLPLESSRCERTKFENKNRNFVYSPIFTSVGHNRYISIIELIEIIALYNGMIIRIVRLWMIRMHSCFE
jgi:hypothetical protein